MYSGSVTPEQIENMIVAWFNLLVWTPVITMALFWAISDE